MPAENTKGFPLADNPFRNHLPPFRVATDTTGSKTESRLYVVSVFCHTLGESQGLGGRLLSQLLQKIGKNTTASQISSIFRDS